MNTHPNVASKSNPDKFLMKQAHFQNQVVIVTGASSGIGKSLALQLADQGAHIALAARRQDRLKQISVECRTRGGKALAISTDVANDAQCKALVEQTIQEFGRLDMLINNAGFATVALFEELPNLDLFKKTVDVNFYGNVYPTYYALPHLMQSQGRIVSISSIGGKLAIPGNSSYVASKFALNGFFDSLRMELAQANVSITMIYPYWVVTEFHESMLDKDGKPRGKEGRKIYNDKMMTAEECAQIVLKSAARRKREVVMGPASLALWLKLIMPGLLDRIIIKFFFKPVVNRLRQEG
jgi:short-subunit dehydrogenase